MTRIRRLYEAQGRLDGFSAYLARLKAEHRRKSSLMGLLAKKGW